MSTDTMRVNYTEYGEFLYQRLRVQLLENAKLGHAKPCTLKLTAHQLQAICDYCEYELSANDNTNANGQYTILGVPVEVVDELDHST